jgi:hypothetical protein
MDLTNEEVNELFEKLVHIGDGLESKIQALPGVYIYMKPSEPPTYKGKLMVDLDEYQATTLDISKTPKGTSKYAYLDKCRDLVQKDIIDQIKADQGKNKTFLLFTRPRMEANPMAFRIRLEGKWVADANVQQIDAPEEIEDPFPCS